jgi:hypothetical protein
MSSNPRNDAHNKELGIEGKLGGIVKQHDRSWPALVAFFAVTTLVASLLFAAVLAGVTVAIAGGEPPQININDDQPADPAIPSQVFSGIVTDARCGPRHKDSQQGASDCARMCVRNGSKYTIVDGDRNYELAGNLRQLDQWSGHPNRYSRWEHDQSECGKHGPVSVCAKSPR